jgi:DNA-binding transcriptional regulator YiaG
MRGEDIQALRKALGLTQKQLAQKLDVEWLLVVAWERGEKFTTLKHHQKLVRLAAAPPEADKPEKG